MLRQVWFWVVVVLAALGALRAVCYRPFKIPTRSMEPTILAGDHLIASMSAYGVRLPFVSKVLFGPRPPKRGDVVVYRFPENPAQLFMHRVIGLPGEEVEIRGRVVRIGGQPLDEPYAQFLEGEAERLDFGPQRVPDGHLFILGDNRDNARDSRFWGFLKVEEVRGRAWRIYYSRDPRSGKVRWERSGQLIR